MISVAIRYGTNENIPKHWEGYFEIKHEFEEMIGQSIYQMLPGIEQSIYKKLPLNHSHPS
ncbi:hypothetical protein C8P63_113107 [Melghirimyces profundicolus]|uniref:Uncharacterized protein n=1 Tax=Melghirimyces profundicolus TaxID=1242148 RepID=A0A2T6BSW8_9BACL|nr:hypothetical protein C8P63_113107 [Melghirimyces profundicolus]